jgi:hypothetical protein
MAHPGGGISGLPPCRLPIDIAGPERQHRVMRVAQEAGVEAHERERDLEGGGRGGALVGLAVAAPVAASSTSLQTVTAAAAAGQAAATGTAASARSASRRPVTAWPGRSPR